MNIEEIKKVQDSIASAFGIAQPAGEVLRLSRLAQTTADVAAAINDEKPARMSAHGKTGRKMRARVDEEPGRLSYAEADELHTNLCALFGMAPGNRTCGRIGARLEDGGMSWVRARCRTPTNPIAHRELYQSLTSLEGRSGCTERSAEVLRKLVRQFGLGN